MTNPEQVKQAGLRLWRLVMVKADESIGPGNRRRRLYRAALCMRLLQQGDRVVGLDNLNNYYDSLKKARLLEIEATAPVGAWRFALVDLQDGDAVMAIFTEEQPQIVVNLAAQAGVRYSLENPAAYIQSNLVGFGHVVEGCRHNGWRI